MPDTARNGCHRVHCNCRGPCLPLLSCPAFGTVDAGLLYPEGPHHFLLSELGRALGRGTPKDQSSLKSRLSTFGEGTKHQQHPNYSGMGTPALIYVSTIRDLSLTTAVLSHIVPYRNPHRELYRLLSNLTYRCYRTSSLPRQTPRVGSIHILCPSIRSTQIKALHSLPQSEVPDLPFPAPLRAPVLSP